jgi:tRNA(Ile)-lysidine synthase
MLLVARVRATLAERGLIARGDRVVVGVSGGPDSTALLDVLAHLAPELSLSLVAVGVDHGLRAEAAAELSLAAAHASALGVPYEQAAVVLAEGSVQAAAREARYAALRSAAQRHGAMAIAVGHTRDDQAETVLSRLMHGAGIGGLGGIQPRRSDGVVRPLLDASRADVERYLADRGLRVAHDPSNRAERYERVRIRRDLLPRLAEEQPEVAGHLAELADEARQLEAFVRAEAARWLADAAVGGPALALSVLRRAPGPVAVRALRTHVEGRIGEPIGRVHLSMLRRLLHERLEVLLPGGWRASAQGDRLCLEPPTDLGGQPPRPIARPRDEEA